MAATILFNFPVSSILTTFGVLILYAPPPMARATSNPPAPIASIPTPPAVGVWLSDPINVSPGVANLSKKIRWHIPLPGFEKYTPYLDATVWINLWSSAFSNPCCNILWSINATDFFVFTLSMPIASNWRYAIVPVESWVKVLSIFKLIGSPAFNSPSTTCVFKIL